MVLYGHTSLEMSTWNSDQSLIDLILGYNFAIWVNLVDNWNRAGMLKDKKKLIHWVVWHRPNSIIKIALYAGNPTLDQGSD